MELKEKQQGVLTNLIKLIIEPFIAKTNQTTTSSTITTIDQAKLEKYSLEFSIQLHQTINQLIKSNQQQQTKEKQQKKKQQQQAKEKQKEENEKRERSKQNQNQKEENEKHEKHDKPKQNQKEENERVEQISNQVQRQPPLKKLKKSLKTSISTPEDSINRAQSEPNHPSHLIHSSLTKYSTTSPPEYPLSSSKVPPIKSIPSPTVGQVHLPNDHHTVKTAISKRNNTQLDQDALWEDLRLCIQSEIEDGFDDLALQFDECLQEAKHQLVSINRSLLESKLGRRKDPGSEQTLPKLSQPLSKIQIGSLGEKLKFQFETHLISCYRDYLDQFSNAIRHSGLGETPLDLKDTEQAQILNPVPQSNNQLSDQPQKPSIPNINLNLDQHIEQTVTKKFENYRLEFQKQACQFRNQIQEHLKQHTETGSNELNETIDQIEKLIMREKNEFVKFKKQIDSFGDRLNQLETQFGNETNPVSQRSNVLKSLGLIESNNDSHQLQKLNLNIFLTKLNQHLRINLSQILISNLDSDQTIHSAESTHRFNDHQTSGPSQIDPQDPNQPQLISKSKNDPCFQQQQQNSAGDEEFIDKLIIKLIMRINQTLSFYDYDENHQSPCQTMQVEKANNHQEGSDLNQDSEKNDQNHQELDQRKAGMDHETNPEATLPKGENPTLTRSPPNHEQGLLMDDNIKQIHLVLNQFFDLNFKKTVWPKFDSLVCQLENYLYSQQSVV